MALSSILSGVTNFLQNPAVGTIGQILGVLGANRAVSANNVPTAAESNINMLLQALMNPNSPMMTRLTQQGQQDNLGDFQTMLREMQLGDRREMANGRSPTFFTPGRADEAMSFLTSRMPKNLATQQAIQRIAGAASGYGNILAPQQARQQIDMQQGVSQASYLAGLPETLTKILGGFQQTPMR